MSTFPFALYDAFSDKAFGGSQAGIVCDAAGFDSETRLKIASEFGWPATCFVSSANSSTISARFYSTKREYPMCGHGTVCLMTLMIEKGILCWDDNGKIQVELALSDSTAIVEICRLENQKALVMLDIVPPDHHSGKLDIADLARLLDIAEDDLVEDLPVEIVTGSFAHLIVPVKGLVSMKRIKSDYEGMIKFCKSHGIETIAVFCLEVENAGNSIHVRDFCPAVGVPESAAAGTTNGALTSYLIRHQLVSDEGSGIIELTAEQGIEIGRPSRIYSIASIENGNIARLQVGGVATKVTEGQLCLADGDQ
ncbi:MAG: PhzF family phenazine biosynthesis protein [Hyphomicrobiales bacterium]|nr:PhzF family phenazine biosynthesis protein [Hyphomicrobiales bacterium]